MKTNERFVSPIANRPVSRRSFIAGAAGCAAGTLAGGGLLSTSMVFGGTPASTQDAEIFYLSASQLVKKLQKRELKSEEVVAIYLQRIKDVNPKINAAVYVAADEALTQARLADKAIEKGIVDWQRQPLFGVPVSFKDNLETAGVPTTAGAPTLRRNVPKEDATVVRKLKDAGAILLAKTNLPLLGMAFDTSNLVYGQTSNPYDLQRSPSGSSGGEAALVAAGGSPFGIGNDGTGSIRMPSHFCGVAGLCPSWGRVSVAGVVPLWQNNGPFFLVNGPIARHVEDLVLALSVIEGWDYRDPFTFPLAAVGKELASIRDLRIAFFTETLDVEPVDSVKDTVEAAAGALTKCCRSVTRRRPPPYDRDKPTRLETALVADDVTVAIPKNQKEYGGEQDPLICELVNRFAAELKKMPAEELTHLQGEWPKVQREMLAFMQEVDVLLCPVCSHPAVKHGTVWDHVFQGAVVFTNLFSLVGSLPKGVVRCGTSPEGLPIGVQVIGAPWRDDMVLSVLAYLEKEFGGWRAPTIQPQ